MAKTYSTFDNRNIKALISQYKLYKDIPCEDIKNIMKDSVAKLKVRDKISVYDVFAVLSNEDELRNDLLFNTIKVQQNKKQVKERMIRYYGAAITDAAKRIEQYMLAHPNALPAPVYGQRTLTYKEFGKLLELQKQGDFIDDMIEYLKGLR
ncbi:TPA: hypothetical protein ACGHKV_004107 [Shigella sonnei]